METIQKELDQINTKWKDIEGVQLISCVPAMVRFKITRTIHKTLDACFMFPENYPQEPIVIELKSKVLADRLLDGLSKVCGVESKKLIGQRMILQMVQFIKKFVDENPLCVCSDEIASIKRHLIKDKDEIKLKQKTSQITLKLKDGEYYVNTRITIPEMYPDDQLELEIAEQNFPELFKINFVTQATEIARQCIQPPLKKKPKDPPFKPKPALYPVCEYLIKEVIHRLPKEVCPCCTEICFPTNPELLVNHPEDDSFVDRMYCGHLFHHGCLDKYMKKPPFKGGKKCPSCGNRIYHEKWKITPELAEARWAHKEARNRELNEVVDFLE